MPEFDEKGRPMGGLSRYLRVISMNEATS